MTNPLRLLVMAAALTGTLGTGTAAAQTVFVRNAPAGSAVEVVVNGAPAGTGTIGEDGNGSVAFTLGDDKAEMDANIFVDTCDKMRRIVIVDRGRLPAPPAEGCDRRDVAGIFWVRPVNTLVFDFGGVNSSVLLIKGSYKPPKPQAETSEESSAAPRRQAPTGFVLFGGGSLTKYRDVTKIACGNVSNCSGSSGLGYSFGAGYWITRFLGAEFTYLNPRTLTISGGDASLTEFSFSNEFNTNVATAVGVLAIPAGPMRFYGKGGADYHQATADLRETIGVQTQVIQVKTRGWGWIYGGGAEGWFTPRFGIYGEVTVAQVKGDAQVGQTGRIDDQLTSLLFGARLRLGHNGS
jgi:outer membrane protein with beta-barrel domain